MKKLILVIAVAILSSAQSFANDKNTNETVQQKLRKEIIVLLDKPQFEVEKTNIIADIEFTLNAKNEIVVLNVDSEESIVSDYVKSRLNYKKVNLNTIKTSAKTFKMTLKVIRPQA